MRHLQRTVRNLQQALTDMVTEREREGRRRRRRIVSAGLTISLIAHAVLLLVLAMLHRGAAGSGSAPTVVSYDFSILTEEQLTDLQRSDFESVDPKDLSELMELDPTVDPSDLTVEADAPTMELSAAGSLPTLAGAGDGQAGVQALAGGGAATSFFGISSSGTRFAYIVDVSGSMEMQRRMRTAMRELAASIEALPDYAHFHIVLFSDVMYVPPGQRGWTRASRGAVARVKSWLNDRSPRGGTEPAPAFEQVFALDVRPDVIFFMTDGETTMTADFVAGLNERGKRVVINTIAFGEPTSQDLLRAIAYESDGTYRYVPSE